MSSMDSSEIQNEQHEYGDECCSLERSSSMSYLSSCSSSYILKHDQFINEVEMYVISGE